MNTETGVIRDLENRELRSLLHGSENLLLRNEILLTEGEEVRLWLGESESESVLLRILKVVVNKNRIQAVLLEGSVSDYSTLRSKEGATFSVVRTLGDNVMLEGIPRGVL